METESKKCFRTISVSSFIMSLYLLFMLGVFPLYYRYQYYKMGDWKYKLFQYASVLCVLVLFCFLSGVVLWRIARGRFQEVGQLLIRNFSVLDAAMLLYFVMVTVSYLLSDFKETGFYGVYGWYMGYLAQFLFVAVYFLVSRVWEFQYEYMALLLVVSAVIFFIGILHRFDIDALWIYGDLELKYKILFLSTMGQSSWYSSFLCTVFPLGLYLFFVADKVWLRLASGIFSVLAMLTLVTQNTDSAYLSLAAVLLLLLYLAFDGKRQMCRFLEVLLLISGSFMIMGIGQRIFAERMIPLEKLSIFMSQSWLTVVVFGILLVLYGWICFLQAEKMQNGDMKQDTVDWNSESEPLSRKLYWILLAGTGMGILLMILFIVLNSNGFLNEYFGYQNVDNYLLFSDNWGNQRGFAWRFTCEAYAGLPWLQKLFGVGPDCYLSYNNSIPELAQQVKEFWGNLSLTNAHNEYLTKLYNLGLFGLVSYVGMLGSAIWLFVKKRREHILLPAFALCTVSYMVHLIFCYEQVCCTPFLYILMGFGSNLIYNNVKKSTY